MKRALNRSQYVPSEQQTLPDFDNDEVDEDENMEEDRNEMEVEDDGSDSDLQPDLDEYFSQWDMPPKDIVAMCRAYASYIAASTGCMNRKSKD